MIVGEKFEIVMSRWQDSRKFKMNVECIYVTEQVLRFKITGGKKEMVMEKLLLKKTFQWKIKEMNFQFEGDNKAIAKSIMTIQNEIEYRINPPTQRSWYKA
jgi:hypothetical protein